MFWADLDLSIGSEQAGRRPVLVISNDGFNARMPVVTVLPITSRHGKRRKPYSFEVELPSGIVGRGIASIVMPHQILTVSKERLSKLAARITNAAQRNAIELRLLEHMDIAADDV
ncbi:MAG: type II toxin-antitoxin system PemK/MazF family toxin [Gemmatimonadaceae bacterium]